MRISLAVSIGAVAVAGTLSFHGTAQGATVPRPEHVVIVIEENLGAGGILGNSDAPYINDLAHRGAAFTGASAVAHPSQPNYLALFSGSTQGVKDDGCPKRFSEPNLATELLAAHLTFGGYSEDLPSHDMTACHSGSYVRKHNPWVNFTNVPAIANLPFTSFPSNYSELPTISIVVPNLTNDMHGPVAQPVKRADVWLREHLAGYVAWATSHHSLLILTWDENEAPDPKPNRILTIFVGPMVKPGRYEEPINHYTVLRTLEAMYQLRPLGQSAAAASIRDIWMPL